MPEITPPPIGLYSREMLVSGFDPSSLETIVRTLSFRQYQAYYPIRLKAGDLTRLREAADHDARISYALDRYLETHKDARPVGIMGGHSLSRADRAYREVALLARELSRDGFLIVTGGGPGAMEAAHLGAFFAKGSEQDLEAALDELGASSQTSVPYPTPGATLLNPDGTFADSGDPPYVVALAEWYLAADTVRRRCKTAPGLSLAVSTWHYGQEPVMPFATAYAAYFQNSIREASLVRESLAGIVYAKGGGGTIREIFQDVEENYYVNVDKDFTPMIFFDPEQYWNPPTASPRNVKIDDVLPRIFARAFEKKPGIRVAAKVIFSTDRSQIRMILGAYGAETQAEFVQLMETHQVS